MTPWKQPNDKQDPQRNQRRPLNRCKTKGVVQWQRVGGVAHAAKQQNSEGSEGSSGGVTRVERTTNTARRLLRGFTARRDDCAAAAEPRGVRGDRKSPAKLRPPTTEPQDKSGGRTYCASAEAGARASPRRLVRRVVPRQLTSPRAKGRVCRAHA